MVKTKSRGVASIHFVATGFNPWDKNKRRMRAVGSAHIKVANISSPIKWQTPFSQWQLTGAEIWLKRNPEA